MAQRELLQQLLEAVCNNVYFQPPTDVQMEYPAVVYNRDSAITDFADNIPYSVMIRYDLTVISRNPDEPIVASLRTLPMCRYERFFVADNLNHDVFALYF